MKYLGLLFILMGILSSCSEDTNLTIVYPKEYLPAYPGSWWTYSNGERSTVYPQYVTHSYEPDINSPANSDEKLVPYIDGEYLYEYDITQMSTDYPLKKLITPTVAKIWTVNLVNGEEIQRKTVSKLDSMYLAFDSTKYYKVFTVVEYRESLGATKWNRKEYYADSVGLIRVEIDNPLDDEPAVIEKELVDYYINW